MRPIPVNTPAFFNRGPSPLARLAFFGVLSLALLFADTRYRYLENVRQVVSIALYPVQRALQMPGAAFAYVSDYFGTKRELADENEMLKQELVARGPAIQGYPRVQQENARLKALLDVRAQYAASATAVQVLYTSRDPFTPEEGREPTTRRGDRVREGRIRLAIRRRPRAQPPGATGGGTLPRAIRAPESHAAARRPVVLSSKTASHRASAAAGQARAGPRHQLSRLAVTPQSRMGSGAARCGRNVVVSIRMRSIGLEPSQGRG